MIDAKTKFMRAALKEADKALEIDEVPVGCVIVCNNKIIARGHNKRENRQDPSAHAEMMAIIKASKKKNNWRLDDCDLYVTLEPCIMCAGAIIQSRIKNVYYGARDFKGGAFGSSINVLDATNINHHPNVVGGILEEGCSNKISRYFKNKRQEKK